MQDRLFDGLDRASLAALVACITYEERRPDSAPVPSFPTAVIAKRFARLAKICSSVQRLERQRGLPQTRDLAGGFAAGTFAWANGAELVGLIDGRMSGGDFVRNTRLVVDLLSQIATVAPDLTTRATARKAAETLRRGVVTPEAATLAEVVTGSVQGANTASRTPRPRPAKNFQRINTMVIAKGSDWGHPISPVELDGVRRVASDRSAAAMICEDAKGIPRGEQSTLNPHQR